MPRGALFPYSDVRDAAEQFVEVLAEQAEGRLTDTGAVVMWESGDRDALTEALTEAGLAVVQRPALTFATREV